MNQKALPPRLKGSTKATLDVRIDLLKTVNDSKFHEKPKFVKLQWWGQTRDEAFQLPLKSGTEVTFDIVTKIDRFKDYLRDAGRLYLETLDHSGKTLGFAVIERLERLVDFGGITADDVEVFNQQGQIIEFLRCIFMFEEVIEDEKEAKKVTFASLDHDYDEVVSRMTQVEDTDEDTLKQMMQKSVERMKLSEREFIESEKKEVIDEPKKKLPSWNLSTERLKFISRVNGVSIKVRKITLNPAAVPHISTFNTPKPPKTKPSYFIKYLLPFEDDPVTLVASKQAKINAKENNVLSFDGNSRHSLRFKTNVLDAWWVSSINLNLFSRHLAQRQPFHIGYANLGLKYLLINSKYSSGSEMKLPIYSAINFRKHLEPHYKEEIIGDIHLTFNFEAAPERPKIARTIQSQEPQTDVILEPQHVPKPPKIVLESRSPVKDVKESSKNDLVLCLLRIDEGRHFSTKTNSLYITCRMFSDSRHVSSPVAWNSNSRPRFELQHVVPIEINKEFLEHSCKDNHLLVEVWNFSEPKSEIVGVATISLHQIYTAFHNESLARRHLSAELPVIAVHDWLSVRDILAGGEIVGEIRVMLAAGLGTQLYRLNVLVEEDPIEKNQCPPFNQKEDEDDTEDKIDSIASDPEQLEKTEENSETDSERSVPKDWIYFSVTVPEARNLPLITSKDKREPPMTYVSISNGLRNFSSKIVKTSCHPQWHFQTEIPLSDQILTDSKRQLIAKIWHRDINVSDYVIGFAAIDLGILLHDGFTEVSGWYNIMDFVGRCRGQVKVEIKPKIDAFELKQKISNSLPLPSPQAFTKSKRNTKEKFVKSSRDDDDSAFLSEKDVAWKIPEIRSDAEASKSLLEKRLSELESLSKQWKTRLSDSNVECESEAFENDEDDRETLERLRANLAMQFQTMQSALFNGFTPERNSDDYDQGEDMRPRMAPDGGNPFENDDKDT